MKLHAMGIGYRHDENFRIFRPSSVRTGIFWRFGSVEEMRPVRVSVCLNTVWILPSSPTAFNNPST